MYIDIGFDYDGGPPPQILNSVCIEVDNVELALNNQPPYDDWNILNLQAEYTFAEDCSLGSPDVELAQMISVYPNPASDVLNISMKDGNDVEKVWLYDVSGRLVREYDDVSGQSVSVNGLEKGIYILKVFADKGNYSERIIIE